MIVEENHLNGARNRFLFVLTVKLRYEQQPENEAGGRMSALDLVTAQQVMNKIWQLRTGAAAGGDDLICSARLQTLSHVPVRASGP